MSWLSRPAGYSNPARDYARDEEAQGFLFWNDERLSAGRDPVAFGRNNSGTGVGGSTLHYTAYMVRAQPADLRLKTEFGVAEDWPFDYATLTPYYDEVEATSAFRALALSMGTGPHALSAEAAAAQRRRPVHAARLRGARYPHLAGRQCGALGLLRDERHGFRPACHQCGFCQAGCATGAKGSADVTWLPLAVADGAEIRPECFVTGFERDAQGGSPRWCIARHRATSGSAAAASFSAPAPSRRRGSSC